MPQRRRGRSSVRRLGKPPIWRGSSWESQKELRGVFRNVAADVYDGVKKRAFIIGREGQYISILQSRAFLCVCAECFVTLFVSVSTCVRSLTICLRFRSVTLPDSWKIVDELTKIKASGHEEMRDSGQNYEVMINMVPGVTRAQAYKGLLNVWHLFALPLCVRRSVVLSLIKRGSRVLINSLRWCWCRGFFVWRPRRWKLARHSKLQRPGENTEFIIGLHTMAHRAHKCSHGLSLIRQKGMPERAVRRLRRGQNPRIEFSRSVATGDTFLLKCALPRTTGHVRTL